MSTELFVQQLVQTNDKENVKAAHYWPFVRGIDQCKCSCAIMSCLHDSYWSWDNLWSVHGKMDKIIEKCMEWFWRINMDSCWCQADHYESWRDILSLRSGGCFTNVSRALQNNLVKRYNARNHIYGENFTMLWAHVQISAWNSHKKYDICNTQILREYFEELTKR